MNWLRLHTDIISDRKIRRQPVAQRWLWITVLCLARQSEEPGQLLKWGDVPITPEDLADAAAIPLVEVEVGLRVFMEQNMLHRVGRVFVVTHWADRQFASDSSTPRVREFRARQRNTESETFPETFLGTDQNQNQNQTKPEAYTNHPTNPPSPLLPDVVPAAGQTARPVGGGGGGFEKMVSVLVSEGYAEDEIKLASEDIREHPPNGEVRSPLALYRKVLKRLRDEAGVPKAAPVSKPEPAETPQQRTERLKTQAEIEANKRKALQSLQGKEAKNGTEHAAVVEAARTDMP
jgi:hypothetical protein